VNLVLHYNILKLGLFLKTVVINNEWIKYVKRVQIGMVYVSLWVYDLFYILQSF
jgi:hypothetical protein